MESTAQGLGGMPQASNWVGEFAILLPVDRRGWRDLWGVGDAVAGGLIRLRSSPRLSRPFDEHAMRLAEVYCRHPRGTVTNAIDAEIAALVHEIDHAAVANSRVGVAQAGLGELVVQIAQAWVAYVQAPRSRTARDALLAAQYFYNERVGWVLELCTRR